MEEEILIIDDEEDFRHDLRALLEAEGFTCRTAGDAEEGLRKARDRKPDFIFLDIVMPGRNGTEVIDELHAVSPEASILMVTAFGNEESAVESFRKGVVDYLAKPLDFDEVFEKVKRLREQKRSMERVRMMRKRVNRSRGDIGLVGESPSIEEVRDDIDRVASTDTTVLISGESGTGKELVARAIHNRGPNSDEPFLPVNCAGIPKDLLESELFGHKKGAFTGAIEDRTGYCEAAGEGTLLLDEIGDMSMPLQSKLLRILEQEEFMPVGSTETRPLEARIMASTNRDLSKMIQNDTFREDLYYRLAVFEIHLPPLRERIDDIPLLVDHFINELNIEMNLDCPGVTESTLEHLMAHDWPGNVRELKNILERCMIVCDEGRITPDCLPRDLRSEREEPTEEEITSSDDLEEVLQMYERQHLRKVLEKVDWNKSEAAEKLGIGRTTLYRKMDELDVSSSDA